MSMSEAEWLEGRDVEGMLEFVVPRATERRLRWFAGACLSCLWPLMDEETRRAEHGASEIYAVGLASTAGWTITAGDAARQTLRRALRSAGSDPAARASLLAVLGDIFGNPFHPVRIQPAWLRWNEGCVPAIAQMIYEYGAFQDLPILGDALEGAGCNDGAILTHCRLGIHHVRGCWVVDALLNEERNAQLPPPAPLVVQG